MRFGPLRHRIIIQSTTETRDAVGGVTNTWGTFATVWASVHPLIGKEFFAAEREIAEVSHRIIMRYYAGVTPKMRVSWDSRTFDIEAVLNVDERDRLVYLMCREVVL